MAHIHNRTLSYDSGIKHTVAMGVDRLRLHRRTECYEWWELCMLDSYQTQQTVRWWRQSLSVVLQCLKVNRRKLQWYGHVSRSSGLAKTILQGTVKGGRRQGRQRKRLEDNIREWTDLEFGKSQRAVENRKTGENWLQNHLWCPNYPRGYEIDDDDDDENARLINKRFIKPLWLLLSDAFYSPLRLSFSHYLSFCYCLRNNLSVEV